MSFIIQTQYINLRIMVGVTKTPGPKYFFYQKNLFLCHKRATLNTRQICVGTLESQLSVEATRPKAEAGTDRCCSYCLHPSAPLLFLHHLFPVQICRCSVPLLHNTPEDPCSLFYKINLNITVMQGF